MDRLVEPQLAEFLIVPRSARGTRLLVLLERRLRARGFDGDVISFDCGTSVGTLVCKSLRRGGVAPGTEFEVIEDQWPEALGFYLKCVPEERLVLMSDRYSLRPIFYATTTAGLVAGSALHWVGAAAEASICPIRAVEQMLVTFNLDSKTSLGGVSRLNPGERIELMAGGSYKVLREDVGIGTVGPCMDSPVGDEAKQLLERAAKRLESIMGDDCCIELSGGLDSRCVLAMANWMGVKPKFAFTLGSDASEDVRIAAELCRRSGVQHKTISNQFVGESLEEDTEDYLEAAGYQVNATAYGWMPSLFRSLETQRSSQVCGQMSSTAFFYTPFDWAARTRLGLQFWVSKRLVMSGNRVAELVGSDLAAEGAQAVFASAEKLIRATSSSFRSSSDEFFLYQRNRQWATVVAHAARYWYRNYVPLLDSAVTEWAWRCNRSDQKFRINQMLLAEHLGRSIAGVKYEGGIRCPHNMWDRLWLESKIVQKTSRGLRNRVMKYRRPPDLNADSAAIFLAQSSGTLDAVNGLLGHLGVDNGGDTLRRITEAPMAFEREFGLLVTLGLLRRKLLEIDRMLRAA